MNDQPDGFAAHDSLRSAGARPIEREAVSLPMIATPRGWDVLFRQVSGLRPLFADYRDIAAIEMLLLEDVRTGRMHLSGVPQAWTYGEGRPAPYIPNITGPAEISAQLWLIGTETQTAANLGEFDPILIPDCSRQAVVVSRLCGVARSIEAEDPSEHTGALPPIPTLQGFCDGPDTAHQTIVLRQSIRATIATLADIIALDLCRPTLTLEPKFIR